MANKLKMKRKTGLDQIDSLFRHLLTDSSRSVSTSGVTEGFRPKLDLSENEDGYIIELEAPGMDPEQIDVSVSDHVLTIRGEKEEIEERNERDFHKVERRFGAFARQVAVPDLDRESNIDATYQQGILRIRVPKSKQERRRSVEINQPSASETKTNNNKKKTKKASKTKKAGKKKQKKKKKKQQEKKKK
jgi:HSP20 family protein